ncbi:MAG TPA: type II toxin-antitoxin system Phd/YefM family antitoxin [Firmicutes bacterium]|nr:type II toxin-antitoxin system Phd/YefM family antitoxin [Bacillota bacterium]
MSKSQFKAQALKYFREVEQTGQPIIITDHDKPVLRLVPYTVDGDQALQALRGSVLRYDRPTDPVGGDDWESLHQ